MSNNILNEIDNIINFAANNPIEKQFIQQQQESAANTTEPKLKKMDNNIIVLEW